MNSRPPPNISQSFPKPPNVPQCIPRSPNQKSHLSAKIESSIIFYSRKSKFDKSKIHEYWVLNIKCKNSKINQKSSNHQLFFQTLYKNCSITQLRLDGVQAGILGAEFLARALVFNSSLTNISFAHNNIRNPGAKAFANALSSNITLELVDLSFNGFDEHGGQNITDALLTTKSSDQYKTVLNLSINMIGNSGCDDILPPMLARSKRRWDFLSLPKQDTYSH